MATQFAASEFVYCAAILSPAIDDVASKVKALYQSGSALPNVRDGILHVFWVSTTSTLSYKGKLAAVRAFTRKWIVLPV